jgi:hypothetical protein
MRERFIISDLCTLHLCPSQRWGTLEKKALTDCLFLRDSGANPIIFCIQGSVLDKEAEKEDIPRIHYSGKKNITGFELNYFFELKKIIDDKEVDLIHCYHLPSLWLVCGLLNRNPLIPLVLTTDSVPTKRIQGFVYKWLARRIDSLVCFSASDKDYLPNVIPIPRRKMRYFGMGIDMSDFQLSPTTHKRIIGCYIDRGLTDMKLLKNFLLNIERIQEIATERQIDIGFHFFFQDGAQDTDAFNQVEEYIKEKQASEFVHIAVTKSFLSTLNKINIYISLDNRSSITYEEMMGMIGQKLVLMPRTASRTDLVSSFGRVAQTYSVDNAREMKVKFTKVKL